MFAVLLQTVPNLKAHLSEADDEELVLIAEAVHHTW